ncbi:uncharacterized protein LOC110838712 [Zootermopsis nevadensis]|uniref:uncharacterized protein LOC110838712 n=1 Tax=Zootermopsis nevadensis TaxID=136037 RepID=UPI000B8E410C|nr:uncharacterized protein LOC110838712 [Zootermopsis nevadensis]
MPVTLKKRNFRKLYHQTCIQKEHQIHIPNDSDDDLFMCHDCFAVEDDTDDEYDTGIFKDVQKCVPGATYKRECNTCRCSADGQSEACTLKFCVPNAGKHIF